MESGIVKYHKLNQAIPVHHQINRQKLLFQSSYLHFLFLEMAADIAMRLDAEKLVLTHYSQRYRPINSPEENTKVSI